MKLLQSKRITLPIIYLIENAEQLAQLPLGIPFIRGKKREYDRIVRILEFEVLLKSAKATGLPFNWKKILQDNDFKEDYYQTKASSAKILDKELDEYNSVGLHSFVEDISYVVDIEYIKNLKLLPTWFADIEEAVKINILNTITYNPNLYNKKLDLVSGGIDLSSPEKNLIIIDISGSIPKSISKAILLLSKTMSTNFYADLLITGSKSTIYEYNEVDNLDVTTIYNENGEDNDQVYFKKLVKQYRKYNTVIVFGDDHSPSMTWFNEFNQKKKVKKMTDDEGKELCKWDIKNIYSFHTTSETKLAGYADWFNTKDITYMKNWVTYLN
jgi:hypothetical protein